RTPSPKVRIHRSQSFDSPTSRISITPIEDNSFSKSTSSIINFLPHYDALQATEDAIRDRSKVTLRTKPSEDSFMSDASSSAGSSASCSPTEEGNSGENPYRLFSTGSPAFPSPSPSPQIEPMRQTSRARPLAISAPRINTMPPPTSLPHPDIMTTALSMYQDTSVPMYDPWLVRVVLDLYDIRGFEWTVIAETVMRMWGFHTCSSEVLGILSGNGRVGRRWWD
ncbi:hypothetical protein DM02DRAFT_486854, partial [Periconia macrospinosa]